MARSFIKWPGSKKKLLPEIGALLPWTRVKHYYEPFLGGGAAFFHLEELNVFGEHLEAYHLNDYCAELMLVYKQLKYAPDLAAIHHLLATAATGNNEKFYYGIRNSYNNTSMYNSPNSLRSAMFIYLNRTCFNGLYRVNSKGKFNVPYGHYKDPEIRITALLDSAREVLRKDNVFLTSEDFYDSIPLTMDPYHYVDAFVYVDPPYHPVLDKASFTAYTAEGFGAEDQHRLKQWLVKLSHLGTKWMLSNSDTEFIRNLYSGFDITEVSVKRTIARSTREVAKELIIRNYS